MDGPVTHSIQVELSADLLEIVREKVRSGEYSSESDVVRDGLISILERDQDIEAWLTSEVAPTFDAYMADRNRGLPLAEAEAEIEDYMSRRTD